MRTPSQIKAEIKRLEKELAEAEATPPEPDAEPAVVFFEKTFGKDQHYTYTAVRAGEQWYITGNRPGRNPNPKSWDQLVEFICQAEKDMPEVWVASQLERLEVEK